MNQSTAARIELHATGIFIYDRDRRDPDGPMYEAAREAVDRAADATGAYAYHPSDGDVWLDTESNGGDYDHALGVIISHLAWKGFSCRVVATDDCSCIAEVRGVATGGQQGCQLCGDTQVIERTPTGGTG